VGVRVPSLVPHRQRLDTLRAPDYPQAVQVNAVDREIVFRVVYDGPPRSGKADLLLAAHRLLDPRAQSQLRQDKTGSGSPLPSFDLVQTVGGHDGRYLLKVKFSCTPTDTAQLAPRRVALAGVDGVLFIPSPTATAGSAEPSEPNPTEACWNSLQGILERQAAGQSGPPQLPPVWRVPAEAAAAPTEALQGLLESVLRQSDQRLGLQTAYGIDIGSFLHQLFAPEAPPQTA
jgi:hypothetical protein